MAHTDNILGNALLMVEHSIQFYVLAGDKAATGLALETFFMDHPFIA
jgi:hypothetical protein